MFIFLILLAFLIIFQYFDFGYTSLAVKDTCYNKGYSCCDVNEGKGSYYFSLDSTCSNDQQCWDYCEVKVSGNLITGQVTFTDFFTDFFEEFKNLFKREVVGIKQCDCNFNSDCDSGWICATEDVSCSTGPEGEKGLCILSGAANQAPTASFTASQVSGTLDVTINAGGSSDDQDPTDSLQVRWDWNNDGTYDTSFTTTKTTTHTYTTSGDKTIKLQVKDTNGATSTTTETVTVTAVSAGCTGTSVFCFDVDPVDSSCDYGCTYMLEDEGDEGICVGSPSCSELNENQCGSTVDEKAPGCSWSSVVNEPPIANAGQDQSVNVNDIVTLDGSGSSDSDGSISSYSWNFGDGSIETSASTTHTYSSTGTYTARLTVTDDDGATDTDTVTVTVTAVSGTGQCWGAPIADCFDFERERNDCERGCESEAPFICGSGPSFRCLNDDGDYVTAHECILVLDCEELSNEQCNTVSGCTLRPIASFTRNPTFGIVPLTVEVDPSASNDQDGTISSYRWDFADGSSIIKSEPTSVEHVYLTTGTYTITLTVTDNDEATDTSTKDVTVQPSTADVETDCTDGIDNDNDNKIDCVDNDCVEKLNSDNKYCCQGNNDCPDSYDVDTVCYYEKDEEACDDDYNYCIYRDYDNNKVCGDSGCTETGWDNSDCELTVETDCTDGIDNDNDNKIDCVDNDCKEKVGPNNVLCCQSETDCYDSPVAVNNICYYGDLNDCYQNACDYGLWDINKGCADSICKSTGWDNSVCEEEIEVPVPTNLKVAYADMVIILTWDRVGVKEPLITGGATYVDYITGDVAREPRNFFIDIFNFFKRLLGIGAVGELPEGQVDVSSYKVYRSTAESMDENLVIISQLDPGIVCNDETNVCERQDTNIVQGATYYYVVTSVLGEEESDYSNKVSVSVPSEPVSDCTGTRLISSCNMVNKNKCNFINNCRLTTNWGFTTCSGTLYPCRGQTSKTGCEAVSGCTWVGAVCGNNVIETGEACDDSNTFTETDCVYGVSTCTRCNADCSEVLNLIGAYCGDGIINIGLEECDDGNTDVDDGCSSECSVESGWQCSGEPSECSPLSCAIINDKQLCTTSDGYSGNQTCTTSNVWGDCITTEFCGDETVNGPEQCDSDSLVCTTSDGYAGTKSCKDDCTEYGSCQTTESCGDGTVNGNEDCSSCPQDVICGDGEICSLGSCIIPECASDSDCDEGYECTDNVCVEIPECTDEDGDNYEGTGAACNSTAEDFDCDDYYSDDPSDITCPTDTSNCDESNSLCAICINPGVSEDEDSGLCTDGIDNDCDKIPDALDSGCSRGGDVSIEGVILLSAVEPYEDSDITLTCRFSVLESSLENGAKCVNAKISGVECSSKKTEENLKDFKCNVGSLGKNKQAVCYVDETCWSISDSRQLTTYLNVTRPVQCEEEATEYLIGILDIDLNKRNFDTDDILELSFDVRNLDEYELDIISEVSLYDLNDKRELASDIQTETLSKSGKESDRKSFEFELIIPSVEESKFRLYLKVYDEDNEDETCGVRSFDINIKESEEKPVEVDIDFAVVTESSISGKKGDVMTFTLDGVTKHSIKFDQITADSVTLTIKSTTVTLTLVTQETKEVDLEDDRTKDIEITLTRIKNNVADLIIKKIEIVEACTAEATKECGSNIGACKKGLRSCKEDKTWGSCDNVINPITEVCDDKLDNDCDGLTDCDDANCITASNCAILDQDTDGDGMSDSWELSFFGSLDQTANGDFDGDGFTNLEEFNMGTDPTSADILEKRFPWGTILVVIVILIIIGIIVMFLVSMSKKPKVRLRPSTEFKPSTRKPAKEANLILRNYVKNSLKKGYSKQQIKTALKAKGWSEKEIEEAFE